MTPAERILILSALVTSGSLIQTINDLAIACQSQEYHARHLEDPKDRYREGMRWHTNRIALEAVSAVIVDNEKWNEDYRSRSKSG
jgi:hypothetical protein